MAQIHYVGVAEWSASSSFGSYEAPPFRFRNDEDFKLYRCVGRRSDPRHAGLTPACEKNPSTSKGASNLGEASLRLGESECVRQSNNLLGAIVYRGRAASTSGAAARRQLRRGTLLLSAGCARRAEHYSARSFAMRRSAGNLPALRLEGTSVQSFSEKCGGVAEWLKAHAWKVCMRETVSRVQIPLPPPYGPFNIPPCTVI